MSRVFPKSKSLEEILLPTSVMVLHVKKLDQFHTISTISFPNEAKPIPDFTYGVNHYKVLEVIYNRNTWEIAPDDEIEVHPSDIDTRLKDHKKYYLIGFSKSIYQYYYEEGISLEETDEALLFLSVNWNTKSLEYAVNGAIHDAGDLQRVKELVASKLEGW